MKHTDPAVQREEIGLITSQFISFKEFGERMNKLIRELANINKITSIMELLVNINRNFRGVFQSENVFLWVSDQVSKQINIKRNSSVLERVTYTFFLCNNSLLIYKK
jgi:hypothetical protein